MSNHEQNESASTQSLHAVLAEYIRRREAGEAVEMESLCAAYPELADGLRSYAEGEGLLEALSAPSRIDSGDPESAETIRPGASQRTDFAPQTEFGRYHLIRQLGSGAMGVVFLAEDTHLGRQVALKIPTGTGTEGPGFLKRFTREAQAAALNEAGIFHFAQIVSMNRRELAWLDENIPGEDGQNASDSWRRQAIAIGRKAD